VFVVYLVAEVRHLWRLPSPEAVLRASVRALLALLLLVLTWVLAWYFTWPLALAVFLGWRSGLARLAIAFSLTCLPFMYLKHYWGDAMPEAAVLLYVAVPLLLALASWVGPPVVRLAAKRVIPSVSEATAKRNEILRPSASG
jgi:hypothetical protein